MTKCYECRKGELVKKSTNYEQYGTSIGRFPAEVCSVCGEVFYSSETVGKIEKALKSKGLWGLGVKTRIGTSGNALDVKLTKRLAKFLGIQKGQEVLIEPINRKRFAVSIL